MVAHNVVTKIDDSKKFINFKKGVNIMVEIQLKIKSIETRRIARL